MSLENMKGNAAAEAAAKMNVAADHGKAMEEKAKDAAAKEKEEKTEDAN